MANTNILRDKIEKNIANQFCQDHNCRKLDLTKKQMHEIFNNMEPDLLAINDNNILFIGEITVSGFMGSHNKDFHIGATRKLAEAFLKLYLYKKEFDIINNNIKQYINNKEIIQHEYHFIVPKGSKFIDALGYRKRVFDKDWLKLTEMKISNEDKSIIMEISNISRKEMQ